MKKISKIKFNIKLLGLLFVSFIMIYAVPNISVGAEEGSVGNPYLISTEQDLIDLATEVNNGDNKKNKHFKQTQDIEVTNFVPIGTKDEVFHGLYDGNFKTVSGTIGNSANDYQGLFGYTSWPGRNYKKHTCIS